MLFSTGIIHIVFSTNGDELFPFSSELMAELSNKACKFFKTTDQFVYLQFLSLLVLLNFQWHQCVFYW